MNELWSAQQHSWLAALGHEVLVQGALPETATGPDPVARGKPRPSPLSRATQSPARAPQPRVEAPAEKPVARRAMPRQASARMPDRLHFALIRASGCDPNAPGVAQLIAQWPTAAQLRGNAAAKRALWPQLRAMRKQPLP